MKTKEEIDELKRKAYAGDASAQNNLGCAYADGNGVTKDLEEAFRWFECAAKQGNKFAQYNTARHYQNGWGVKEDIEKAIEYYTKSACLGFGKAANALGKIYENGHIELSLAQSGRKLGDPFELKSYLPSDHEKAYHWYYFGAEYNEQCRLDLARCCEKGIGTEVNLYRACCLYLKCNLAESEKQLSSIVQRYNPFTDVIFDQVDILGNNPYRILGVFSNTSEKELRAQKSKLDVMAKLGKETGFPIDQLLPDNSEKRSHYFTNIINSQAANEKHPRWYWVIWENINLDAFSNSFNWSNDYYAHWRMRLQRNADSIAAATQKISSNTDRVKYSLFWFSNATRTDESAFQLLREGKWTEAGDLWNKSDGFSAKINHSILCWYDRNIPQAIFDILDVIHKDSLREEFLQMAVGEHSFMTEEELAHLFWDSLFDFPHSELSLYDLYKLVNHPYIETCLKNDFDYCENKFFGIIKDEIDLDLLNAESQNPDDFVKAFAAYNTAAISAKTKLRRMTQLVGDDYYKFKLLSNDVALKLLNYAIHYNDNYRNWKAPEGALVLAKSARDIAVDETLKERCERNVGIFSRNQKIATLVHYREEIEKELKPLDGFPINLNVEKIIKNVQGYLLNIKTIVGASDKQYQQISDNVVHKIANTVIRQHNIDSNFFSASSAYKTLGKLKDMPMSTETRDWLNRNFASLSKIIDGHLGIDKNPVYNVPPPPKQTFTAPIPRDIDKSKKDSNGNNTSKQDLITWILICMVFVGLIIFVVVDCSRQAPVKQTYSSSSPVRTPVYSSHNLPRAQNPAESPSATLQSQRDQLETGAHARESSNGNTQVDNPYIDNRLTTGSKPYSRFFGSSQTGDNYFHFKTSGDHDYVVIVKRTYSGTYVNHIYIRGGDNAKLYVPNGTFDVFFYSGKGWDPEKSVGSFTGGFVRGGSMQKDEEIDLYESERGIPYVEYTLYPVSNGNLTLDYANINSVLTN